MKTHTFGLAVFVLSGCASPAAPPAEAPAETPPVAVTASATAAPPAAASSSAPEAPPEAAPEPKAAEPPPGSPAEKLMRAHFKEAELIRNAVITGRLAAATSPADALTKMEGMGKLPAKSAPLIAAMKSAAKRIGTSPDIPATAAAIADVGVACGGCHKLGGGPKADASAAPAADATLKGRMRRHAWATERLWEGLYVPSDSAWKAGADLLAGADPFPEEILKSGGVHARSSAQELKSLVATANDQKKPEDRAKLYASLLATCSSCHMATRKK